MTTALSLPDRYIALISANVERLLANQCAAGHFRSSPNDEIWLPWSQAGIYPLALLYKTAHPLNSHLGDVRLRDAATRAGDQFATVFRDDGHVHYNSRGYDVVAVDQWLSSFWLESTLLLGGEISPERRDAWTRKLTAAAAALAEKLSTLNRCERFHTRSFNTSPNHAVTYAAYLNRAAGVFSRPEWFPIVDEFVSKFLALQDADGAITEYEGPVVGYGLVSLTGLGLYHENGGRVDVRPAIERFTGFLKHALYPDGSPVALFDGRMQHHNVGMPWGHFALSLTPEGRGLCDVIMGRVAPDAPLDGHTMARLAEDFRYFHRGPVAAAPARLESFAHRMQLPAGMRKQGPWTWALAGIHTPSYASSPWSLDRQTLVGVYHDACGLVINDAQCKESRHVATFVSTVEPTDALPFRAQLDDDVSRLSLRYRDFDAELTVTRISDDELELVARILNCPPGDVIRFHLQPDVHPGAAVTLDAAARTLGAEEFRVAGVRSISWQRVTLSFDREAEAWWPFRGYNSYSANHTYPDLNSARLITEVALTSSQPRCTVRLRVRPDKTAATPP